MISEEQYNQGIRCKGMCFDCRDNTICYQSIKFKEKKNKKEDQSSIIEHLKKKIEELEIRVAKLESKERVFGPNIFPIEGPGDFPSGPLITNDMVEFTNLYGDTFSRNPTTGKIEQTTHGL
jgi:hypothetical protein